MSWNGSHSEREGHRMNITFLTLEEVMELHNDQIQRHGGEPTIRDTGLLQSAIAMPAAAFGGEFLHEFPHGMAAAYLFHLVANHPFVDGNKRTAFVAVELSLALNGIMLNADDADCVLTMLAVAAGDLDETAFAHWIRDHATPR